MDAQLFAWFLIVGLVGLVVGLVAGVFLASALVKGHYTHILTNQARTTTPLLYQPQPQPRPQEVRRYREDYY